MNAPTFFFSFRTHHRFCNRSEMTGGTIGVGTAYHYAAPQFTPSLDSVTCCLIFNFPKFLIFSVL